MATPDQRIYNADQARLVLENEAFIQAMADIKQELTEQWKQSPARDQEGREKLWQMLRLADKLELTLQASLESGKLARIELDHERTMLKKAKEWVGLS